MQLEAMMKQRFSWMALLLLTACFVRSSLAGKTADGKCDGDGIVGTFSQEGQLDSLTITPVEYDKTLNVSISMVPEDTNDRSIQIYLSLSDDSTNCSGPIKIVNPNDGTECIINYQITNTQIQFKDKAGTAKGSSLALDYNDPYQASFELRTQAGAVKVSKFVAQTSSGDEVELGTDLNCLQDDKGNTTFNLIFGAEFGKEKCQGESGAQFEMKGKYEVKTLRMDETDCTVDEPGTSDEDEASTGDTGPTTAAVQTTTAGFPQWAWYVIGGCGGALLLIILVVIIIIVYCFCFAKKASAEDVEAAPEEESDIQPTDSTVTGQGAEQSGVDPTQQNPDDKPEDNAEDKPEDNAEDKPDDE